LRIWAQTNTDQASVARVYHGADIVAARLSVIEGRQATIETKLDGRIDHPVVTMVDAGGDVQLHRVQE
jgi:hypothetical protein